MKKFFSSLFISSLSILALAQPATRQFDVDGITVILKPTAKEIINVRLYYRGGVNNYTASQAGIERFALSATVECGTARYTGTEFRDAEDKYGIRIGIGSEPDYGDIDMECVSQYFNQGWDLFTEAVMNPVFDNTETELLKNKIIASLRQAQSTPNSRGEELLLKNAFEGTPYAIDPDGDENVIKSLTADNLSAYYKSILNKNQVFIVVAGKISEEELTSKIKTSFASMPVKEYKPVTYREPVWNDYKVLSESRSLATNYINAIINSPQANSPEYVPYRMGIAALGGFLFSKIRTELNLSYDPAAFPVARLMPYSVMHVSTTKPKEAVEAMTAQLIRLKGLVLSKEYVQNLKSSFITNYYMREQSTSAITTNLGTSEILGGWYLADSLPQLLNKVTSADINAVLNKYVIGLRWSYLGNIDQEENALKAFQAPVR